MRCTLFAVLLVTLATPAFADFEKGARYFQSGDIGNAVEEWTKDAQAGHAIAAWLLARLYERGEGVPQVDRLAFRYYLQAGKAGNADAQTGVGRFYLYGSPQAEIRPDYQKAMQWLGQAALKRDARAQYLLAHMYWQGLGVSPDRVESLRWLDLSASKAYVPAFARLAERHARGEGVPADPEKAAMYLSLGGFFAQGDEIALVNQTRDDLKNLLTPEAEEAGALLARERQKAIQGKKTGEQ